MTRAQGARSVMALNFESIYGTPETLGYHQVPFVSTTLGSEQPLLDNEVLGFGRDPLAPSKDALNSDGNVVIPMDVRNFGFWLKATFGAPVSEDFLFASGYITFTANPAPESTVTINGTVFTFKSSGAVGNQVDIGLTRTATLTALAVVLNASVVAGVALATYTSTATRLNIAFDAAGLAGNDFTLAASALSTGTVSNTTLDGGRRKHTFTTGNWDLPSVSIETQMPEIPKYSMFSGGVVDQLSWEMQRSGLLQATVDLICRGEDIAEATVIEDALVAETYTRFTHFNGEIRRGNEVIANITQARVAYMNNLDRIDAIRADGRIEGADPSIAACKGQIVTRFSDMTLINQAIDGTACELSFIHEIDEGRYFRFNVHAVYLPRPRTEIAGPGGIEVTFDWQAAQNAGNPIMATAVLVNTRANYA
jgi:Phage tail tube protein